MCDGATKKSPRNTKGAPLLPLRAESLADLGEVHGARAPPWLSKRNALVKKILQFTNEVKNLNNVNFESIETVKQKATV